MKESPGLRFRNALKEETPLQVVGTINAYDTIRTEGTRKNLLNEMQTREELYVFSIMNQKNGEPSW